MVEQDVSDEWVKGSILAQRHLLRMEGVVLVVLACTDDLDGTGRMSDSLQPSIFCLIDIQFGYLMLLPVENKQSSHPLLGINLSHKISSSRVSTKNHHSFVFCQLHQHVCTRLFSASRPFVIR